MIVADVRHHGVGQQELHVVACYDCVPHVGRADGDDGRLVDLHVVVRQPFGLRGIRGRRPLRQSGVDQHAVQRHQSLVVFPSVERLEVVLPHDDAERQIGMNPAQVMHRIGRVVGPGQIELHVDGLEVRLHGQAEARQLQALSHSNIKLKKGL